MEPACDRHTFGDRYRAGRDPHSYAHLYPHSNFRSYQYSYFYPHTHKHSHRHNIGFPHSHSHSHSHSHRHRHAFFAYAHSHPCPHRNIYPHADPRLIRHPNAYICAFCNEHATTAHRYASTYTDPGRIDGYACADRHVDGHDSPNPNPRRSNGYYSAY
jgi:hypothetical protein